jgi:soluble lytic murein transglycosylase-like protein
MQNTLSFFRPALLIFVLLLAAGDFHARPRSHSRRTGGRSAALPPGAENPAPPAKPFHVRLVLVDGSRLDVDEAWENEQGIWYKKNGISYLGTRDRVTAIERGDLPSPATTAAAVPTANTTKSYSPDGNPPKPPSERAWIHLTGGARMEAERIDESAAGVWYHRGSLSIFIDRARIDHIEREELEVAAKSDSSSVRQLGWSSGNGRIDALIKQNGARYGVDPYLIFCVMEQESHFNARVVSPQGARGLMQLMPGTGARFGVRHPFNPSENISAGARYLKQLTNKFNGRIELVLAAYNAGEGAVVRFGHKVPPYAETRNYVKRISYRYRRAKVPVASNTVAREAMAVAGN